MKRGGKSKRRTRKKTATTRRSISRRPNRKFINTKNKVIQTINYGMEPILKIHTVGGAILDDINFRTAKSAFEYFLMNSTPKLFKANSLSGRIMELNLNEGIQSPYTSYNRKTFIDLNIGDIKTLIVKFILVADENKLVDLPNKKRILISTERDLQEEYILQNYIACKTANSDINNKYLMAVPYNVYTNSRLSISSKKVLFAYLLKHKANEVWPYFYKLGIQDYNIGIIVMTKVEGMIGDELIDKEIYKIDNKLGPELSSISLSPSSPNRDVIDKPKTITLLTKYLVDNKKTWLQRSGIRKYSISKQDKDYMKLLLKIYSPYVSIIYSILRIVVFAGYIHTDLHQDNYFIVSENTDYFNLSRAVIIDWGQVHKIPKGDRSVYLDLWNKEKFITLLDEVIEILSSPIFNRGNRLNNTYNTLMAFYKGIPTETKKPPHALLGKSNTEILLKMYHNQCKIRSQHYNNKIDRLWSSLDNTLSILELETYLLTAEEKFGDEMHPSMHMNLLMMDGYKKRSKTRKKSPSIDINKSMNTLFSNTQKRQTL